MRSLFEVPLLKIPLKHTFVTGEKYTLSAKIKNMGTSKFPGGSIDMKIIWPNRLVVSWKIYVKALAPNEMIKEKYGVTDVLDDGPALLLVRGHDTKGKKISFCNFSGKRLIPQPNDFTHVHTIIPKSAERLYTLWALIIAAASLLLLLVKDVVVPLLVRITSA